MLHNRFPSDIKCMPGKLVIDPPSRSAPEPCNHLLNCMVLNPEEKENNVLYKSDGVFAGASMLEKLITSMVAIVIA